MIRSFTIALMSAAFTGSAVLAAPVAAFADPPSYNDDGMHYDAPADFEKLDVPAGNPTGSDDSDDPTPVAVFVWHKGKVDQRAISIAVARYDGRVDQFDATHISDQRKNGDAFVVHNDKTALANGMPAYFVKITSGATAGQYVQRYEYLVCDGTRSIVVSYAGQQGTFDDATAKAALASLYVVVYPRHRS